MKKSCLCRWEEGVKCSARGQNIWNSTDSRVLFQNTNSYSQDSLENVLSNFGLGQLCTKCWCFQKGSLASAKFFTRKIFSTTFYEVSAKLITPQNLLSVQYFYLLLFYFSLKWIWIKLVKSFHNKNKYSLKS